MTTALLPPTAQAQVLIDDFSSGPAGLAMHAAQNPSADSGSLTQFGSMASAALWLIGAAGLAALRRLRQQAR